ncbi:hypothetical protein [Micromonospora sp. NPDC048887]|uniref:hypothetical protein n=1 Tax=unclassified Micromonospora TaxID=2617518 RepID=UPI0033CC9451
MSVRFRISSVELATDAGNYTYSFAGPCTVLDGPVGTGKSSLLELIKHVLGGNAVLTPVVRSEVNRVRAQISLNGIPLELTRGLAGKAATSVEFRDPRDGLLVEQVPIRSTADRANVSETLLSMLGIPVVAMPRARTKATAASVPLTFNDIFSYLYVEQQEIDRSIVHHTEVFREPKRRAVFELMFGLLDPEQLDIETELGRVRDALRAAEGRAAAVRTFLETATDRDEQSLRERQLILGEQAEEAARGLAALRTEIAATTHAHEDLRSQVLRAEEDAQKFAEACQLAYSEVARREHALAQLHLNVAREDKARTASRRLSPLEFVVCPRCTQHLDEGRAPAHVCPLCLQADPLAGVEFEASLGDSEEQVLELESLLARAMADADRAQAVLDEADQRLRRLKDELDLVTAQAVTPRFSEVELLSSTRGQALAELEHTQNLIRFWDELRSLESRVNEMEARRNQLEERLAKSKARLKTRRSVLSELSELFEQTVGELQVPWATSASIDGKTYLPLVNGERFESLAVAGGTKTIVTVAYHLTILGHALAQRDTLLPQFIILDTPRKNLGVNPSDKAMGARIYDRVRTLVDAYRDDVQFIIADNDFPEKADWIRSLHFDYERPLLPHVVHPGEEAAKAGMLDTVDAIRGR